MLTSLDHPQTLHSQLQHTMGPENTFKRFQTKLLGNRRVTDYWATGESQTELLCNRVANANTIACALNTRVSLQSECPKMNTN